LPLDIIQERNLFSVIDYALEYPSMILSATKVNHIEASSQIDFSYGLYVGYISGVFFDKFISENNRFLNDDEMSDFYSKLASKNPEIMLKIKTHLKIK
jgi:hypothetical protein